MKVATIGTGFIVDWFLNAVKQNEGISCVAMYSRNVEHAKNLKEKYEVEKVYTDLDGMIQKLTVYMLRLQTVYISNNL